MDTIEKEYPIGRKASKYPSQHGVFPATVTGHKYEKNLNTGEITPIVIVTVHGVTDAGEQVDFEESFARSFAPF